ncbi:MAG TPA: hypothetical protein VE968_04105 [Sphingomicrobium sp.]|nr:hypothetical protein [Sphingomicrobium sp.]
MLRTGIAIVAGLIAWVVIVTLLNFGLRASLPGYHAAEATLQFSAMMKAGRLAEAALSSIASGAVVKILAPSSRWGGWILGLILLAAFVPVHIQVWNKLPLWYHLTFLLTLAPLVAFGALLAAEIRPNRAPVAA